MVFTSVARWTCRSWSYLIFEEKHPQADFIDYESKGILQSGLEQTTGHETSYMTHSFRKMWLYCFSVPRSQEQTLQVVTVNNALSHHVLYFKREFV